VTRCLHVTRQGHQGVGQCLPLVSAPQHGVHELQLGALRLPLHQDQQLSACAAARLSMAVLPLGIGSQTQRSPPCPMHCMPVPRRPTHCLFTPTACNPTQGTLTTEPQHTTRLSPSDHNLMHCKLTPQTPHTAGLTPLPASQRTSSLTYAA
jgi:hypothetical protein